MKKGKIFSDDNLIFHKIKNQAQRDLREMNLLDSNIEIDQNYKIENF